MQVIVHEKLVGAVCSVPCRMAFPPQELLWLFGFESIDIGFPLRDDSEGLPHKFVGDRNNHHLAGLAITIFIVLRLLSFRFCAARRQDKAAFLQFILQMYTFVTESQNFST